MDNVSVAHVVAPPSQPESDAEHDLPKVSINTHPIASLDV